MADILLSVINDTVGGGFKSDGIVYTSLASGQTGSLLSLPEVQGKVYRVFLLTTGTSVAQAGISFICDSVTIEDQKTLADNSDPSASSSSEFGIVRNYFFDTTTNRRIYNVIECLSFEITKNAGNTTTAIDVSYELGSYA